MAENPRWNKKIFALLLDRARGMRSWRQFAAECDISYVQMRKLAGMTQENPPRPKLLRKVAAKAFNDVDLEDFMFAAGLSSPEKSTLRTAKKETVIDRFHSLPTRDRRTVEALIDFLAARSSKEQQ